MEENKEMLERILSLTEKNNKLLKKIHSGMVWSRVWRFIYWAVIISFGLLAYYYIEPFIAQFFEIYESFKSLPFLNV